MTKGQNGGTVEVLELLALSRLEEKVGSVRGKGEGEEVQCMEYMTWVLRLGVRKAVTR